MVPHCEMTTSRRGPRLDLLNSTSRRRVHCCITCLQPGMKLYANAMLPWHPTAHSKVPPSIPASPLVTSRSVKLTWVKRCARNKLLLGYRWLHMRFDRSRSFNVIDFCFDQKPIYDFLLVINCDLGSILHRFRDIAPPIGNWKLPHPSLRLKSKRLTRIWQSNLSRKKWDPSVLYNENYVILASVILSQYTRDRNWTDRWQTTETTHHVNSRTLQCYCSVQLKRIRSYMIPTSVLDRGVRTHGHIPVSPLKHFVKCPFSSG